MQMSKSNVQQNNSFPWGQKFCFTILFYKYFPQAVSGTLETQYTAQALGRYYAPHGLHKH